MNHTSPSPAAPPSSSAPAISSGDDDHCTRCLEIVKASAIGAMDNKPISSAIDRKLLRILVAGKFHELLELDFAEFRSAIDENSVLHIAASSRSQSTLISELLPRTTDLIKRENSTGDLAVHTAAKAGNLENLKALCDWGKYEAENIGSRLLGIGNEEGDTPLHIAMMNNDEEMGLYLVEQHPEACYQMNQKHVAPMYLAIKAGFWGIVGRMIEMIVAGDRMGDAERGLLHGKSVVHAAIEAQQLEILKEILKNFRNLIESHDEDGRTPLSYAAFKGYLQGVQYLLEEFSDCAYKCDNDESGSFPIHSAASGGHIKAIKALHSTKELCNRKGQNILHIAAGNGKSDAVLHLLKIQELERLINMKDEDGNTPLHLATLGFHPRVVYILTREAKVKPEVKNKDGLTALDVAEIYAGSKPTFEARLTWMALRYIDAPRSSQSTRKSYVQRKEEHPWRQHTGQKKKQTDKKHLESYKKRIDTNLLVATLVATVTFAAGFTLPGGYKQDGPHIGLTVLPHRWAFNVFVICNTAAMYSSILAVVILIWAHLEDLKLILVSLTFALPLLGFALAMMSIAFMMGVYVVLRNQMWLSYVVLCIGFVFLVFMLVFFIPLYNPSYIRNKVVRFFYYGSFLLLLLVCEKSQIDYA